MRPSRPKTSAKKPSSSKAGGQTAAKSKNKVGQAKVGQSKSSKSWLKEHFRDEYVQKSWQDGYRSRATYKLIEIQEKDHILRKGQIIVDLGAAPGGWSQYASSVVGKTGKVIALDILPITPLEDVSFIEGDFREPEVLAQLEQLVTEFTGSPFCGLDLVISDIAPNTSGIKVVDQSKSQYLVELAYEFATQHLEVGGDFLCKVFQGPGFDALVKQARSDFQSVFIRKPKASRARSIETYLLARTRK